MNYKTKLNFWIGQYEGLIHRIARESVDSDKDRKLHNNRLKRAKESGHAVLTFMKEMECEARN